MQTVDEYLNRTESAVRRLFDGINDYVSILRTAVGVTFVTSEPYGPKQDAEYAAWKARNAQRLLAAREAEQILADMNEAEADDFYASEDDVYEEQTLQAEAAEQTQEAGQQQQQQQQQKAQQQQQEEKEEEEELLNAALSSLSPGLGLLPDLLSFADPASWTSPEPTAVDDAIRQLDTVGDLIMLA
jgi:cobalamin biosynthesis protein CobT